MPSTSAMLLHWDKQRARSQQRDIGWSEIGGCRRRAGYRLAHTEPDNESGSVQAVMGTAIDEATNVIALQLGLVAQQEVTFLGILGHFDRVEPIHPDRTAKTDPHEVVDVKTVGTDKWLEHMETTNEIPQDNRFQVHGGYASGLILDGWNITHVRIDYIARDSGREWTWREPYNPLVVKRAVEWLKLVRDTDLEMLPRDYEPDGMWCKNCPFFNRCWGGAVTGRDPRSVIHVEDPDTAKYARRLRWTRAAVKRLQAQDKRLAGILDAVRPDEVPGKPRPLVDTGDGLIEFRPTRNGNSWAIYFRGESAIEKGVS